MESIIHQDAKPFSREEIAGIGNDFRRDGYALIPNVLGRAEIEALKAAVDRLFANEHFVETDNVYGPFVGVRLFETDPVFLDLLVREPIIGLVESILGADCHLVAQNVVRNEPGQALDSFHADDLVIFPVAEGMERHDPRLTLPVFLMTVQVLLTDVPSVEYGPTQFVPGSHYSGRKPNNIKDPTFEGRKAVSILANAGDIYLHNGQCWHRGAPNTSDRARYLLQLAYGRRFVSQRFYPFMNYKLPDAVMERTTQDERLKRVLGFHEKGDYG